MKSAQIHHPAAQATLSAYNYLFNGKEFQDEMGWDVYDFHSRYYDAVLGRFTTVDPLADKEPGWSPYRAFYCNPINFTDPTGMLEDWFQNELTGDVYYNSELRKGDESRLGEGWVHLGENQMFSDGTPMTSDATILYKNSRLTESGVKQTLEYDKPKVYADAKVSKIKLEASFKGKNAERFMSGQGYDKKPFEANVYSYSKRQGFPEPHGVVWQTTEYERTEKVHSWRYIPKGVEGAYDILGYYGKRIANSTDWKTNSYKRETWERRRYDYNRRPPRKPGTLEPLFWEILKILPVLK